MKKQSKNAGVITLEAALLMPLFILLMLFLYAFFIFFMGQQIMSHTAIQTAKSLSFDPYTTTRTDGDNIAGMILGVTDLIFGEKYSSHEDWYTSSGSGDLPTVAENRFKAFLPNQDHSDTLLKWIGVEGLNFYESKVEDGILTLKIKYTQNFAFKIAGLTSFERVITLKIRLFDWHKP